MSVFKMFAISLAVAVLGASAAVAQTAKASIMNVTGQQVGSVVFSQTPHGVLIRMSITKLPSGERAFHIHAAGRCEAPFTSAGGHFNPDGKKHGLHSKEGHHAGDMPNINISADGSLNIEVLNSAVTLEKGKSNSLLKEGGTSLIIHEGKDDYRTDPTGEAGGRIACGIIQ